MGAPDLFTALVDNSVLVGVDVVGKGTGRCSPEMGKELVFCVERNDRKGELPEDRSRWGGRGDNSNGGFDDSRWEVLNWDIREWNAVDNFFKLKVDVGILSFVGGGVLELQA